MESEENATTIHPAWIAVILLIIFAVIIGFPLALAFAKRISTC